MVEVTEVVEIRRDLFVKRQGEMPCRNPARIPEMIQLMHAVWAVESCTDMRMGQLLMTAARMGGWSSDDLWNCEEEIFAAGFLKMLAGLKEEANEGR